VPKKSKDRYRVALLPSAAYQLIKRGHQVIVEKMRRCRIRTLIITRSATLVADHAVFEKPIWWSAKEPQPSEYPLLRPGQILFTYLHLAAVR
jgi:alanine dehydrogenase